LSTSTIIGGGTELALPRSVSSETGPTPADIWRGHRNRFFVEAAKTSKLRVTMAVGALLHVAIISIMIASGYPTWRALTVGGLFFLFNGVRHGLVAYARDNACVEVAFVGINIAAQLFVVSSAALTGGLHSPFLPNLALSALISLLFFGPVAAARWIALANGLLIVAMAMLPTTIVGPALDEPAYTVAVLVGIAWNLIVLHQMAGKLAVAAERTGDSYACLREERVVEAEAQLRRLQSVGAKVAHELKNPLASIKGLCQLVARTPDSERTQERLAVVSSEIARMETILGEYLSFSRPLEDLAPEAIDLSAIARDVLDVLAGRADQAGVALSFEGDGLPAKGDPRRLKEALLNLVANAIEASGNGTTVRVRARRVDRAVVLDVVDSGRGIAPEHLERLGTSFFTTRENGTGLGVVLAQGVIAQHGGTLAYQSALGRGTTATITLPVDAPPAPEPTARAAMIEARA
jgi:signal transduction histidine kinase